MDPPAVKLLLVVVDPLVRIGWQAVYFCDLEGLGDLGTDIERVRVVVRIGVLEEPEVEPALDGTGVSAAGACFAFKPNSLTNHCDTLRHVIHSISGIRPWLDDNGGAVREVEGVDFGLYPGVGQANSLDRLHVVGIDVGMLPFDMLFMDDLILVKVDD